MALPALTAFSLKLAFDWLGPIILRKLKLAIEEADGKFGSDWRRQLYVSRQFKRALGAEGKLIRTKRGFRKTIIELLVCEWKAGRGIPGFDLLPKPPLHGIDPEGFAGV